jgi:hypothetical protein
MPLPSPKGKEEKGKFVSRCVSDLTRKGEGKDSAQRVAICNSRFKKSKATQIEFSSGELEALNNLIGSEKKKKKKKKKTDNGVSY